jgi:hypothetical protein
MYLSVSAAASSLAKKRERGPRCVEPEVQGAKIPGFMTVVERR